MYTISMSDIIKQWFEHSQGILRVKSQAMSPLIWLCGLTFTACVSGILFSPDVLWVKIFLACLAGIPLLFFLYVYVYWMKKDPDRLGSEAYLEKLK